MVNDQYDDGTPKYYYELYNPYSRKFIAPQIKGNQILSDKTIGINLPGRRENQYYSTILAWDNDYYAFAGVKPDDADSRILSCYRDEADTFYFAIINEPLKTLTKVNKENHKVTVSGNEEKWASGRGSSAAKKRDSSHDHTPIIAYIDVFNKPFTLEARKISERTGVPLAGAHFALYRSVKVIGGEAKDLNPLSGYENLVSGENGIIPKIDNSLDPGKYYLTELTPPDHYSGLNEDIVFTVSELGFVTIDSAGHGDMLRQSDSEYENAYSIVVPNELIYTTAELTLTKTVKGILGDRNQNFRFTVNVEGADSSEQYQWIKNSEPQTVPLRSGSSFMLQHGDTVVITLPQHLSVTVTEESEDYDASFKLGSGNEEKTNTKTFLFEENETLEVTNTRNGLLATGIRLNGVWPSVVLLLSLTGISFIVFRRRLTE